MLVPESDEINELIFYQKFQAGLAEASEMYVKT